MKRTELERKFDEMIAFAGVEKFIDTPVKHYSSGMYLRLAFSVAAHMEPDILLVDEVLAVGDAAFQDKCLGKMKEVSAAGRTVLLVTHNMGAVQSLCPRSLLLSNGRLEAFGDSSEIIGKYLMPADNSTGRVTLSPAASDAYYTAIALLNEDGDPTTRFDVTRSLTIEFRYRIKREIPALTVSFSLFNRQGMKVFYCPQARTPEREAGYPPGEYCARVTIPRKFLAPGQYYITAAMYIANAQMFDLRERVAHFEIAETGSPHYAFAGLDNGCVLVDFAWTVQQDSVECIRA
jgi:lipopolysaccharide transport system ATP-binding protein